MAYESLVQNALFEATKEAAFSRSSVVALRKAFALLRVCYLVHQNAHWEAKGTASYADHLLFERLYKSAAEDVDALAERLVGLTGVDTIDIGDQMPMLSKAIRQQGSYDLVERSIAVEEDAVRALEVAYRECEENDDKTLGLDDLLMQISNHREEALYLLKQRNG